MAVLTPLFRPFVEMVADEVAKRLLPAMEEKEPRFFTREEAAKILHVSLPTLAKLTQAGRLAAKRIGGRVLYDAESINEAVEEGKIRKYERFKR